MPKGLTNKEKYELIAAYLNKELDDKTSSIIKNYIENDDDAKNQYNKLKKNRTYFFEAYQPVKNKKMRPDTKKMINNYYFKRKVNYYQNLFKFLKKPIPKIALAPAFVAGFLGFAILSPFTGLNIQNIDLFTNIDNTNTLQTSFDFDQDTKYQMKNILNKKNFNDDKKIKNLEIIINKQYSSIIDDHTKSQYLIKKENEIKLKNISVTINEENSECFSIEILSNKEIIKKLICKTNENDWIFKK